MAPRRLTLGLALACLLGLLARAASQSDAKRKTAALLELQRKSPTGVINLSPQLFEEYATGKSRPYTLVVVADSANMRSQGKLQLGTLMSEYGLMARACAAEHEGSTTAGKVFFTRVEYTTAKDLFGRMGIKSLPWMARIPPSLSISKDGTVKLKQDDMMPHHSYPWSAEFMSSWVEEKTGVRVGEIKRTSFLHSRLMPFVTLGFVCGAVFVGYNLYYAPFMRNAGLYMLGALVIWWFAVSGGMYNIIRGVPLVGYDPRTKKASLFLSGSGQLGAEGFIMGTLYTAFGLVVAFFCSGVPKIKDLHQKRVAAYFCLGFMFFAYNAIASNHTWKTGLRTHWYLF